MKIKALKFLVGAVILLLLFLKLNDMYQSKKVITIKGATIDELWEAHADVANWSKWQENIDWTKTNGKIVAGSKFVIKPKSGPKVNLEVLTFEKPHQFTDVSFLPLSKMVTTTKMKEVAEGVEVELSIEMKGILTFLWKKIVAKDIINGHQAQNESMVRYIQSLKS